jgi:hypothetical protein
VIRSDSVNLSPARSRVITRRYPMYAEGRERLLPAASSWISRPSENGPYSRTVKPRRFASRLSHAHPDVRNQVRE